MTHKQVKFGKDKRPRKVKPVEEDYEGGSSFRRAVLLSSDDVERMAVESSRARLINHLVSKSVDHSSREFASYYRGTTRYLEPPYSITSHTNGVFTPTVQKVIPAYPSLISAPRWYPYSKSTSAQNSDSDLNMDHKYTCRCEHCTSRGCPGSNYNKTYRRNKFKDNIMTFNDQYTMTRKVLDAGCGSALMPPAPAVVDAILPGVSSMVAIRDAASKVMVHQMCSPAYFPVPILKKGSCYHEYGSTKLKPKKSVTDLDDEIVRDIEPLPVLRVKSLVRKEDVGTDYDDEFHPRKNIYNEGISDVVAIKMPLSMEKVTSRPVFSRSSMSSDSDVDGYDQYAPRSDSRYHRHCTTSPARDYYMDEATEAPARLFMIPKSSTMSKPCRRCKQMRNIKLPKKVLQSEKVVDACTNKRSRNKMPCRRK
ncbi:hypothetical protein B5X24_HaOG208139 [Helicoverpa armigera]|uniref:Uncharacterized protein n=1 Tax=Helicoverpa armigera TaxID=29058 RepID=A0A2W1BKT2_HELAM|nr:hypothetical protein B5X24_HaOG208139 [Helicoverpa armigera]